MWVDHLVWYGSDLAQGRRHVAAMLDAEPAYGGAHPGEGTANAVAALGPTTYLEILGRDPEQKGVGLAPELAGLKGQGLYHWSIGGVKLEDIKRRAEKAGLIGSELVAGHRILPTGKRLSWICFGLHRHRFGALIPFFIDWRDSDHPAASAQLGGTLERLRAFTPEPADLKAVYGVLGVEIPIEEAEVPSLAATIRSSQGQHELKSFSPLPRGFII